MSFLKSQKKIEKNPKAARKLCEKKGKNFVTFSIAADLSGTLKLRHFDDKIFCLAICIINLN